MATMGRKIPCKLSPLVEGGRAKRREAVSWPGGSDSISDRVRVGVAKECMRLNVASSIAQASFLLVGSSCAGCALSLLLDYNPRHSPWVGLFSCGLLATALLALALARRFAQTDGGNAAMQLRIWGLSAACEFWTASLTICALGLFSAWLLLSLVGAQTWVLSIAGGILTAVVLLLIGMWPGSSFQKLALCWSRTEAPDKDWLENWLSSIGLCFRYRNALAADSDSDAPLALMIRSTLLMHAAGHQPRLYSVRQKIHVLDEVGRRAYAITPVFISGCLVCLVSLLVLGAKGTHQDQSTKVDLSFRSLVAAASDRRGETNKDSTEQVKSTPTDTGLKSDESHSATAKGEGQQVDKNLRGAQDKSGDDLKHPDLALQPDNGIDPQERITRSDGGHQDGAGEDDAGQAGAEIKEDGLQQSGPGTGDTDGPPQRGTTQAESDSLPQGSDEESGREPGCKAGGENGSDGQAGAGQQGAKQDNGNADRVGEGSPSQSAGAVGGQALDTKNGGEPDQATGAQGSGEQSRGDSRSAGGANANAASGERESTGTGRDSPGESGGASEHNPRPFSSDDGGGAGDSSGLGSSNARAPRQDAQGSGRDGDQSPSVQDANELALMPTSSEVLPLDLQLRDMSVTRPEHSIDTSHHRPEPLAPTQGETTGAGAPIQKRPSWIQKAKGNGPRPLDHDAKSLEKQE